MIINHLDICQNCGAPADAHTSGVFNSGLTEDSAARSDAPLEEVWESQIRWGHCADCKKFTPSNLKYLEWKYEESLKK